MKVDKVEQLTKEFRSDDRTITKDTSCLGLVTKQETVIGHTPGRVTASSLTSR